MEVNAISIETFFASVAMAVTYPAQAGTIDNRFATARILDNSATECANNNEFALAQHKPDNQESPSSKFASSDGLSDLHTIAALMRRIMPHEELDKEAGSNYHELVAALPCPALEMPCERAKFIERDVHLVHLGGYHSTDADHYKVDRWLATRQKECIDQRIACWLALAAACLLMFPGGLS